jgi:hypothetical protein
MSRPRSSANGSYKYSDGFFADNDFNRLPAGGEGVVELGVAEFEDGLLLAFGESLFWPMFSNL